MAFVNGEGLSVSFECTDLIKELKQDIAEFSNNSMIEVIAKKSYGVTIYTDYNFIMDDKDTEFELEPGELALGTPRD